MVGALGLPVVLLLALCGPCGSGFYVPYVEAPFGPWGGVEFPITLMLVAEFAHHNRVNWLISADPLGSPGV